MHSIRYHLAVPRQTHRSGTTPIRTSIWFFWTMYNIYIFMQCAPDPYEFCQWMFGLSADVQLRGPIFTPPYLSQRSNIEPVWTARTSMNGKTQTFTVTRWSQKRWYEHVRVRFQIIRNARK
eukprot:COSAG05_NODE_86_length_20511_cov_71.945277_15_plen_121_part_00